MSWLFVKLAEENPPKIITEYFNLRFLNRPLPDLFRMDATKIADESL